MKVKKIEEKPKDVVFEIHGVTTNEKGEFVEQTLPEVAKEIEEKTGLVKDKTFTDMTITELDENLVKFIEAVKIIKEKMINSVHYLEIKGVEKPIITKQGTAGLASATGMTTKVEETKEIIKPEIEFILYQHKATASWGEGRSVSAYGTANSQEYNQKRKFEDEKKQKTVYDVINDVVQMSQKRARSQAIKEMIAMTDIFETNEDNPLANSRKQQSVYSLFYKVFMKYAITPPKKRKLKNGKGKTFNEKEKLNLQKEYLRAKYLQPMLIELGLPTHNWGIKDIEILEKEIPEGPKKNIELNNLEKELLDETENTKTQ